MMLLVLSLVPCLLLAGEATERYQIVFLRPDPARKPLSKEEGDRIQKAHMANMIGMAERGILLAAGPFDDKVQTIGGVFFFKFASTAEAFGEAAKDPTVLEHRNTAEVLDWRGPKGLGDEYRRLHAADPQMPDGMGVHPFVMLRRTGHLRPNGKAMRAHVQYVAELRAKGKLLAAGPVAGDARIVEVLIFDRIPDEEAGRLMTSDPAVGAGLLTAEAHRWWSADHVLPRH